MLAAQVAKAVEAETATTPTATSIKKRLNIQPKNLARVRFIQFFYTVRNIPNRICKTASKFEKEILKIGRRIFHVYNSIKLELIA